MQGLVVDSDFEQLLEKLQSKRDITVLYDKSLPIHRDKWSQLLGDNSDGGGEVINVDPVRLLYLLKQNLRCIDMLVQMDKDDSFDLSRSEIRKALDVSFGILPLHSVKIIESLFIKNATPQSAPVNFYYVVKCVLKNWLCCALKQNRFN